MRHLRTAAIFLIMLAAGCGSVRYVLAKGKITNGGKSVLVDVNTSGVILMFHPVAEASQSYSANFSPADSMFYVYGPQAKGIPAGKYKVVVTITGPRSATVDKFNERFNSLEKTPIEVDVENPDTVIEIDLAKYPAT